MLVHESKAASAKIPFTEFINLLNELNAEWTFVSSYEQREAIVIIIIKEIARLNKLSSCP